MKIRTNPDLNKVFCLNSTGKEKKSLNLDVRLINVKTNYQASDPQCHRVSLALDVSEIAKLLQSSINVGPNTSVWPGWKSFTNRLRRLWIWFKKHNFWIKIWSLFYLNSKMKNTYCTNPKRFRQQISREVGNG